MTAATASNFAYLREHDEQLVRLGMLAEKYFAEDPNTCLLKVRQFAELLPQLVAARVGIFTTYEESQYDLLQRLKGQGILPRDVGQLFADIRRTGNLAAHAVHGDHSSALSSLKVAWQLGLWFHRTFKDHGYRSGPFVPPRRPKDQTEELRAELDRLQKLLSESTAANRLAQESLVTAQSEIQATTSDRKFWEQMAAEAEAAKAELEQKLSGLQLIGAAEPTEAIQDLVAAATEAAQNLDIDEIETRKLIDSQLRDAGWEVDTRTLRYGNGTRPVRGANRAIAEWPTSKGPADYVLFVGLTPVAVVEAKRKNKNVAGSLQQAKRYSRAFRADATMNTSAPWGEFHVPFGFATNARPFFRQLAEQSGCWFIDLRSTKNLARPLDGWYTPEGLLALLKRDEATAHSTLLDEPFDYGFPLRDYQRAAIQAVERAIGEGQRNLLLAMATGTGKTKTCIALIFRLLKVQRFRRVLFLVDRQALGEQAAGAFKDTRMENLRTFAETFGIKEIDEATPDDDTFVHIATVQGMVKRVLNPDEGSKTPPVDAYDCIVVDECHRGYLLDRELSDIEMSFRSFDDYVSKYRQVLDAFDAVKIGLTATPALHTTQIFGDPVFTYSYREAVVDGFLVDHEPPIQIETSLSKDGIKWLKGEKVKFYDPVKSQTGLFHAPDEIKFKVEDFNRKVITRPFNETVCAVLAKEIDPNSRQKTLIFCVSDAHADLVVNVLKAALQAQYGEVEDEAVMKITGASDQPLRLIRRYKNEVFPSIAVTVDLLTTGIDVPEICNLVFLRRVNSRILFDQMLGRATRLCPEVDKDSFRVFDAVYLYDAIKGMTAMQPVVTDPHRTFADLIGEITRVKGEAQRRLVLDELLAKIQRRNRRMSYHDHQQFEQVAGVSPEALVGRLRKVPLDEAVSWFATHKSVGEVLDRPPVDARLPIPISEHRDTLVGAEASFKRKAPADYIQEFKSFVQREKNRIPAIIAVTTRPRELTRKQLRELALLLDNAGYSEASLSAAWRNSTNQEIAARIVGFVRQAALGDPLVPYDQRVDQALQRTLASQAWSAPQRQWLQKIAAQTKANQIVDREALEDPDQLFKREAGGYTRLNKIFDGKLDDVLARFNDDIWKPAA